MNHEELAVKIVDRFKKLLDTYIEECPEFKEDAASFPFSDHPAYVRLICKMDDDIAVRVIHQLIIKGL